MEIIFGKEVWNSMQEKKLQTVPKSTIPGKEHCFSSDELCQYHQDMANLGYLGAQLVESIYGWTVRYDSGIQNFGIIAGVRSGQLDGSREDALQFAKNWQTKDSSRRYVSQR